MRALLALHEPPHAVFCLNDLLVVGAAEQDRRVPADRAVVGFDGSEEGAYTTPTRTTIVTDKAAMAEAAVERLVHRIVGEVNARKITMGFMLETRESTVCGSD
jgi:DNA-binding LacI/PurR family transcriptional regulator